MLERTRDVELHEKRSRDMSSDYSYSDVAKMIDHSLLNPTLTWDALGNGTTLALAYDVASVCIMPYALKHCAERLCDSNVYASTTVGFPMAITGRPSRWPRLARR